VAAPTIVCRRHLLLAGPSLVVGAAVVAYAGLFVAVDEDDLVGACEASCALHGDCDPELRFGLSGTAIACRTTVPLPCARMRVCGAEGLCTEHEGRCVAGRREDCLPTPGCRSEGRCTPLDEVCAVGDDADCHGSLACRERFACTAGAFEGRRICRVGSTADCRRTFDCKVRGLCTWVDDHCEAASDEDCRGTQYCHTDGLCSFDPARRLCFAKTDTDCSASTACALQKRCYAVTDLCRSERERD
jgi:hypothetical protein